MKSSPVPSNLKVVPELDSYIRTILSNNNKSITLKYEKVFKSIQEKLNQVFGPLNMIWCAIDEEKTNNPEDESISQVSQYFEQVMLLLGQTHNTIYYYRRENILSTLIDSNTRVKDILKSQSKELNDESNKYLFGDDFESKLIKDTKAIKKV